MHALEHPIFGILGRGFLLLLWEKNSGSYTQSLIMIAASTIFSVSNNTFLS